MTRPQSPEDSDASTIEPGLDAGDETGAAMVEFAFVLPILLLLLVGIIQFGLAFNAQLTLQHAAREGARVFAIARDSGQARTAAKTAALPSVTLADTDVRTGVVNDAGGFFDASTCTVGTRSGVRVSQPFTITMPGFTLPLSLEATGVMRCGG